MRLARLLMVLALGVFPLQKGAAMFLVEETREVPIGRVLTNLHQRLALNTNDFKTTYSLARVYSMAYSTNLQNVKVAKDDSSPVFDYPGSETGAPRYSRSFPTTAARSLALTQLTNAIMYYQRCLVALKHSTNNTAAWHVLPSQFGLAWCLEQAGRTNEAKAMYRLTLKLAWKREVTGDFSFKEWASDAWEDVKSSRNPLRTHNRGFIGPGVCFSDVSLRALLQILDPVTDKSEIAQLKQDQTTLRSMGRAVTPIIVPLTAEGAFEQLVNHRDHVAFDLDGSGWRRPWAWLNPNAGWLVYDPDKSGRITSALQMFGNVTFWVFWPNGYEALSALDDDQDGKLAGAELHGLAIWNDRNSNGVSDPGEVFPVEDLNIASLSCRSSEDECGMRWNPEGVVLTDGSLRPTYDWEVPSADSENHE